MMAEQTKQSKQEDPEQKVSVSYARRPNPVAYVDYAIVNSGYYGFKFSFATHIHTSNEPLLEEFATVGMSPEHAKVFHASLGKQLEAFEKRWGPIRPRPEASGADSEVTETGGTTGE